MPLFRVVFGLDDLQAAFPSPLFLQFQQQHWTSRTVCGTSQSIFQMSYPHFLMVWARSCLSNRKSCQSKLTFVQLVCASPGHSLPQYLAGKQHLVHRREAIMNFNESINSTTITKIISHLAILTTQNFNISHNTYNDRKEWILVFLSYLFWGTQVSVTWNQHWSVFYNIFQLLFLFLHILPITLLGFCTPWYAWNWKLQATHTPTKAPLLPTVYTFILAQNFLTLLLYIGEQRHNIVQHNKYYFNKKKKKIHD